MSVIHHFAVGAVVGVLQTAFRSIATRRNLVAGVVGIVMGLLEGCSLVGAQAETTLHPAELEPLTHQSSALASLPAPKGVITVAVYGFRDQTGQYKQAPDSSFSTAVSQGGSAMLVKALRDSKWFQPVEREGLQDLLTERKILRAVDDKISEKEKAPPTTNPLPNLTPARLLMEGAVVGYDENVTTGGLGVKFLGWSLAGEYRKDQVTVNLRAVDINNGTILHTVTTTKTVYSKQITPGIYRYISYKDLLEVDSGYTYNEPAQLAVQEAIESAVVNLVVEGIYGHSWVLANAEDINQPLVRRVHDELSLHASGQREPAQEVAVADHDTAAREVLSEPDAMFDAQATAGVAVRDIPLRTVAVAPVAPEPEKEEAPEPPPPLPPVPSPEEARARAVQKQRKIEGRADQTSPSPSPSAPGSTSPLPGSPVPPAKSFLTIPGQ